VNAMSDNYIDLSKRLLKERETYVKYREEAVRLCRAALKAYGYDRLR
jgi:hypothetical protein